MPQIDVRKIIPIGKSSFAVILPIGWLRYYDLNGGDFLDVLTEQTLVIKPHGEKKIHSDESESKFEARGTSDTEETKADQNLSTATQDLKRLQRRAKD